MNKILKRAGFVFLPLIILLIALFLYREQVSYYILKNIAQFYAGREHIHLSVGRISGSPFSGTNFSAITVRPEDGQPQVYQFKAQTIRCSYKLWDLRQGFKPFLQGLQCTAEVPEFAYDLRIAAAQDRSEGAAEQISVPAVLPGLSLHNGTVVLQNFGWNIQIRNVNSTLQHDAEGAHELQLQVENFQFIQDDATRIATGFTSVLRYVDERLVIDSFVVGEQDIAATGFIDLAKLDKGIGGFAADLAFGESQLHVSGTMKNQVFQVRAKTENFNIRELQERLGGTGWDLSGKIRGTIDLAYDLGSKKDVAGSFALNLQDGKVRGVKMDTVSLAGSLDAGILHVSRAEARTPGNHVLVSDASVPLSLLQQGKPLSILAASKAKFDMQIKDFESLLELVGAKQDVPAAGFSPESLTIKGYLEKGDLYLDDAGAEIFNSRLTIGRAEFSIPAAGEDFAAQPINVTARFVGNNLEKLTGLFTNMALTGQVEADLHITGSLKEPQADITFAGKNIQYNELLLGSLAMEGKLQLLLEPWGRVKSAQFTAAELIQTNEFGRITLTAPTTARWHPGTFLLSASLQLDNQGEADLKIEKLEQETAAEIITHGVESTGWMRNFIDKDYVFHDLDIKAVFTGLPQNPQLQVAGTISKAGTADFDYPLSGRFNLQYSSKGIKITKFTWKSENKNQLTVTGFLPYDPLATEPFLDGPMRLKGYVDFPSLDDISSLLELWGMGRGSVVLDMDIAGSWDKPEGSITLHAEDIDPPLFIQKYFDSTVNVDGKLTAEGNSIVLQGGTVESGSYFVQATGSWQHAFSIKQLLRNRKAELQGAVTADATMKLKDLNFLQKKFTWLRRLEGEMTAELHISGPVADPAVTGAFSLKDGEVVHTFNLPKLSRVNLQGEFDADSITINTMAAEMGGAPVNFSGSISREDETIALNLRVTGKNILLFRNNYMQMRGNVKLDISGPVEQLAINGTTGLTGGYYTRNIDFLSKIGSRAEPVAKNASFLFSFTEPPLKDAVLNIKITTIEPFRIRNNLIRGTLRPELSLKGTGELPFLVGTVYADPSRVLLPSGRLQIQSGLVRFLEGEPDRPQLDLLAQSKVLGYDINVVIRGPLDDPVITLSSSPALPNDELLLLLLTGQPPQQDLAGGAKSSGTTNVMVYLGRDFLGRWLEEDAGTGDESILDRFEIDFGRGVTKSGERTVEATFRLSELEPGKRKVYYLTAEKDRYDAYNYGLKLVFRFE